MCPALSQQPTARSACNINLSLHVPCLIMTCTYTTAQTCTYLQDPTSQLSTWLTVRELDEDERATMAEGGFDSPQYLRFLKQPSANMDDSGYFSVQVCTCVCMCVCVCVCVRERERERYARGREGD